MLRCSRLAVARIPREEPGVGTVTPADQRALIDVAVVAHASELK